MILFFYLIIFVKLACCTITKKVRRDPCRSTFTYSKFKFPFKNAIWIIGNMLIRSYNLTTNRITRNFIFLKIILHLLKTIFRWNSIQHLSTNFILLFYSYFIVLFYSLIVINFIVLWLKLMEKKKSVMYSHYKNHLIKGMMNLTTFYLTLNKSYVISFLIIDDLNARAVK